MMFKEFGLWFPPYKINLKTNFLVPMTIILINNWNIYSWHRLVRTFVWLNIVSCQFLNHLTLFSNPSSMRCNTNFRCKLAFAFVKCMLWILHANILMCEVACSQSVTLPSLHSFMISCIIMTNYARALSIGVDEFIVSLDLTMAPMGRSFCSMLLSPSKSMIPLSFQDVHFHRHHWILYHLEYVVGPQTCDPTLHDVIHTMFHNYEWYPPKKCLCMWEWSQFGVYTCSLAMPIHMCNKIFWWMGISPHKWHWENIGSICPKLHHSQGLVGIHGWME